MRRAQLAAESGRVAKRSSHGPEVAHSMNTRTTLCSLLLCILIGVPAPSLFAQSREVAGLVSMVSEPYAEKAFYLEACDPGGRQRMLSELEEFIGAWDASLKTLAAEQFSAAYDQHVKRWNGGMESVRKSYCGPDAPYSQGYAQTLAATDASVEGRKDFFKTRAPSIGLQAQPQPQQQPAQAPPVAPAQSPAGDAGQQSVDAASAEAELSEFLDKADEATRRALEKLRQEEAAALADLERVRNNAIVLPDSGILDYRQPAMMEALKTGDFTALSKNRVFSVAYLYGLTEYARENQTTLRYCRSIIANGPRLYDELFEWERQFQTRIPLMNPMDLRFFAEDREKIKTLTSDGKADMISLLNQEDRRCDGETVAAIGWRLDNFSHNRSADFGNPPLGPANEGSEPRIQSTAYKITIDYGPSLENFVAPIPDDSRKIVINMAKSDIGSLARIQVTSFGWNELRIASGIWEPDLRRGRRPDQHALLMEDVRTIPDEARLMMCEYINPKADVYSSYVFWYKSRPASMDPARLRSRHPYHPLLGIRPPAMSCPDRSETAESAVN